MRNTAPVAAAILTSLSLLGTAAAQAPLVHQPAPTAPAAPGVAPLDPAFQGRAAAVPNLTAPLAPPAPTEEPRNVPFGSLPDAMIDRIPGGDPRDAAAGNLSPAERAARSAQQPAAPRAAKPGIELLRQRQAERTRALEDDLLGRNAPPPQARRGSPSQAGLQPRQPGETDPMRRLGLPPVRDLRQAPAKAGTPSDQPPVYDGFDRLDRNGDGFVSEQEYMGARGRPPAVGLAPDAGQRYQRIDQSLNRRFRAADTDRDGRISVDESRGIGNRRF
ncbi:MAG: hypothetical protein AB7K86_09430 [Rhodospirillales bacterium]